MNDLMLNFGVLLIIVLILSVKSDDKVETKSRIVNKSDHKKPMEAISAQTGEVFYEDESEFQADTVDEEGSEQWVPSNYHHIPYPEMPYDFGSMSKRYGHSIIGDDFALFLVILTIAGFFGLILSMLMPLTFLLSNGGLLPLGLGGINGLGLGGLGGLGVGGLGGLGINGGLIGRKRRSKSNFKEKLKDALSGLELALDKYKFNK